MTETDNAAHSKTMSSGLSAPQRLVMWLFAIAALLTPLFAMQFTSEVSWSAGDFMIFAGMLLILCGSIEAITRGVARPVYRAVCIGVSLIIFLFVWAALANG